MSSKYNVVFTGKDVKDVFDQLWQEDILIYRLQPYFSKVAGGSLTISNLLRDSRPGSVRRVPGLWCCAALYWWCFPERHPAERNADGNP